MDSHDEEEDRAFNKFFPLQDVTQQVPHREGRPMSNGIDCKSGHWENLSFKGGILLMAKRAFRLESWPLRPRKLVVWWPWSCESGGQGCGKHARLEVKRCAWMKGVRKRTMVFTFLDMPYWYCKCSHRYEEPVILAPPESQRFVMLSMTAGCAICLWDFTTVDFCRPPHILPTLPRSGWRQIESIAGWH